MSKYKKFPKIMGILNVTPDSFSDGGIYYGSKEALKHALKMLDEGADIIDIGGESSRPYSDSIETEEEISRVIPVIKEVKKRFPDSSISIDTVKYEVAKAALDEGADLINDISGLQSDIRLAELAASYQKSLVIMHMQGTPKDMQQNPSYVDVVSEVKEFLTAQVEKAKSKNVESIFIDVGIGFGKTIEHNLELLRNLEKFKDIGSGILLGISRKSFLGHLFGIEDPSDRDAATVLFHSLLIQKPVDIIRVHNVKMIKELKNLVLSLS